MPVVDGRRGATAADTAAAVAVATVAHICATAPRFRVPTWAALALCAVPRRSAATLQWRQQLAPPPPLAAHARWLAQLASLLQAAAAAMTAAEPVLDAAA